MKNIFTLMLAIITASHCFAYDFEVDGIYYNILSEEDKTVEVTYSYDASYSGNIVINDTVSYSNKIYSITVIGDQAFLFCNIDSIFIPNSVMYIGSAAFAKCERLTGITIPNSVTSIGDNAFEKCGLTSINIPNSVTSIGDNVFLYCHIKEVNMYFDDENDFRSYLNRYDIFIYHCNGLNDIEHNIIISGEKKVTITIPNSVNSIGAYAFSGCSGLTSITIPNSVTSIGDCAFNRCSGLTSIAIPNSVTSIGSAAFSGCSGITSITIPNSVTSIGSAAFSGCSGITSITIPNSVTSIGSSAFYGCSGITSITIPNSVTSIGSSAFYGCSGITDVTNFATTPQTISSNTFPAHKILHVLPGCKELFQTYEGWRDFLIKEDAVIPIEEVNAESFTISDGSRYNSTVRTSSDNLSYKRTFNNTTWQSLYVPFSIPVSKLTESGLIVAELNDTHQRDYNSDGVADSTWIEFFTLQSGSTEANYPYLIKANAPRDVTINLEDVTVEPADNVSIECSTTRQRFTFTGTYEGVSGSEMYSKNYYALAGGSLKRAASSNASIKPQRWYMTIENKNGTTPSYFAPSMRFVVDGIEDETTSIEAVIGQYVDYNVYSISGSVHSEGLKPAIYVQNGKKIIVK